MFNGCIACFLFFLVLCSFFSFKQTVCEFDGYFLGWWWKWVNFSQDWWQARESLAQLNPEPKHVLVFGLNDWKIGYASLDVTCCTEMFVGGRDGLRLCQYRPRTCRAVHSWVADNQPMFPLNILIRMSLLIKKKRWQSIWENRYFKMKPLTFLLSLGTLVCHSWMKQAFKHFLLLLFSCVCL